MEITIEQLKTFSPDLTPIINGLLLELNSSSRMLTEVDLRGMIEGSSNRLLVARESMENKIVGMVTLITVRALSAKKGIIEDLVVDKNYQGKGIGKRLINEAVALARNAGVTRLDLTSNPKRVQANNLYRNSGFKMRETNVYRLEL